MFFEEKIIYILIIFFFFSSLTLKIPTPYTNSTKYPTYTIYCLGRIYVNRYQQGNFCNLRLVTARVVWNWSLPLSSLSLLSSVSYESQMNVDFNLFWIVLVWKLKCYMYWQNKSYAKRIRNFNNLIVFLQFIQYERY